MAGTSGEGGWLKHTFVHPNDRLGEGIEDGHEYIYHVLEEAVTIHYYIRTNCRFSSRMLLVAIRTGRVFSPKVISLFFIRCQCTQNSVRRAIGVVPQDTVLFNKDIR